MADGAAFADFGDVAQWDGGLFVAADGQVAQVFEAFHHRLRHLDLQAVALAGFRIGPVVGHGEAAARSGGDEAAGGIAHLYTEQARAFAVDVHIDARVVEGLAELHVTQVFEGGELGAERFGMRTAGGEVFAADGDLDGGGRSERHDA